MNKIKSNFAGQTIFIGMDVHKNSWNLGLYLNELFIKNVHQKPHPQIMANYLRQHYPGAQYKAVYERKVWLLDTTAVNKPGHRMSGSQPG